MMKYRDAEKLKRNQRATNVTKLGRSPQIDIKGLCECVWVGLFVWKKRKSGT